MEKKKQIIKNSGDIYKCTDKLCPLHGIDKLKLRGRTFEGVVIKKAFMRAVILFERVVYIPKYERYEKRKTKMHARLPKCMDSEINIGDLIEIAECRPLSKIIHFVVTKKIKSSNISQESDRGAKK
jgi:small subunit ribosomal protein S17